MFLLPFLLGLVAAFLTGSGALETDVEILEPIRETGDEVALIFTSGGYVEGKQYQKTAQAIQEASALRVWVALTGEYTISKAGLVQVTRGVDDAIKALEKAGMTSDNYVGVAHGRGGQFLERYAKNSKLKAVVLMGSCLPRDSKLQDYPLPVLTLAAELDGVTRITRMAEEFGKLKDDMTTSFASLYRNPVAVLAGVNHRQFGSGNMPLRVTKKDLTSNVTEEDAHLMIGKHVNSFLTATFSSSSSMVDSACAEIEEAFYESFEMLQPFLTMKALDKSGNFSQWTIMVQQHVAGEFANQIQVNNEVGQNPWFFFSEPSIRREDDGIVVDTTSLVHTGLANSMRESPLEIDMKLKTKDAIWDALTLQDDGTHLGGPHTSLRTEPITCKSLNELALEVALRHSSQEAQDRYKARGRPIIFEDDSVSMTTYLWGITPFNWWETDTGLHVKAISYFTDLKRSNPGMLYCKLMSPYRAMEWVNIDSLTNRP